MLRYTWCNIVILMAATAWLMLSFSSCIVCGFDSYTVLFKCPQRKVRYTNQIRTRYRNWRTISATQLQPSKSLCYIGYTSTRLDARSCILMQEATTFNIFYDGMSFQRMATVLISVFRLRYGPGLLFRGAFCICFACWALANFMILYRILWYNDIILINKMFQHILPPYRLLTQMHEKHTIQNCMYKCSS
jgi:hypothetical protein